MAAPTLPKTAYVILGMLALGRRTGYEIKSLVDVSTRFFWAASYGQIYPELRRLEEARLIRGHDDPSDGRRRKIYELTDAGRKALEDWLTSHEPLVRELRHEGVLKMFFSDVLDRERRVEQIRRMRAEHEAVLETLRSLEPEVRAKSAEQGQRMCYLTLRWGLDYQEFLIDWCDRMERELAAEAALEA